MRDPDERSAKVLVLVPDRTHHRAGTRAIGTVDEQTRAHTDVGHARSVALGSRSRSFRVADNAGIVTNVYLWSVARPLVSLRLPHLGALRQVLLAYARQ